MAFVSLIGVNRWMGNGEPVCLVRCGREARWNGIRVVSRKPARMMAEGGATEEKESGSASDYSLGSGETPQWVTDMSAKLEDYKDQIMRMTENVDAETVKNTTLSGATRLFDNLVQGEWLGRGEIFGGIQIIFVYFLLQDSRMLDGLASLLFGPVALLAGMVVSAKALFDLGLNQLSLWPKPVPGGELRTEGLYAVVRHPVYSGLLLAALGWSAASHSPARFALTLALAVFLDKKIAAEEEFLESEYPSYGDYKSKVTEKIIPRVY